MYQISSSYDYDDKVWNETNTNETKKRKNPNEDIEHNLNIKRIRT